MDGIGTTFFDFRQSHIVSDDQDTMIILIGYHTAQTRSTDQPIQHTHTHTSYTRACRQLDDIHTHAHRAGQGQGRACEGGG